MGRAPRIASALLIAALWGISPAHAQRATEQFIPIGQSPGLSGTDTSLGKIEALDPDTRTLRISGAEGAREVVLGDDTQIWLDRTAQQRSNVPGTRADCEQGRSVEVKLEEVEGRPVADWIKVRIGEAPTDR